MSEHWSAPDHPNPEDPVHSLRVAPVPALPRGFAGVRAGWPVAVRGKFCIRKPEKLTS